METLALVSAAGSEALGFRAPEPCRVLYVDGEMASLEIQERFTLLRERLGIYNTAALTIVAADWQETFLPRLDTKEGQAALEPFVEAADLIILDNRSCLLNSDGEKDPSAWQPTQDWLLSLRRRLLIKLTRPDDYRRDQGARFLVSFEKSRGAYGAAMAPFLAHLRPGGWMVESATEHREASISDKLIEYLTLAHEAGERPKSANAAIRAAHVNRAEGLRAWADLTKTGMIRKHHEGGWFCAR